MAQDWGYWPFSKKAPEHTDPTIWALFLPRLRRTKAPNPRPWPIPENYPQPSKSWTKSCAFDWKVDMIPGQEVGTAAALCLVLDCRWVQFEPPCLCHVHDGTRISRNLISPRIVWETGWDLEAWINPLWRFRYCREVFSTTSIYIRKTTLGFKLHSDFLLM